MHWGAVADRGVAHRRSRAHPLAHAASKVRSGTAQRNWQRLITTGLGQAIEALGTLASVGAKVPTSRAPSLAGARRACHYNESIVLVISKLK